MIRKALEILAVIVIAVVGLFLAVAAFLPGTYTLERSIEIARPPALVYSQVADFNAWMKWSPWPNMDPAAEHTVTGTPGTVGMHWSWSGEELGVGAMTIEALEPNRSLHSKLEFKEPMQSIADDYMELEPTSDGGTRVTWRNTGQLPYPIARYFGLTLEGMLGPQYEEGLASLKALCEAMELPSDDSEMTTES
jgi:uncharacterized protein YndB with AHSA1/START domain